MGRWNASRKGESILLQYPSWVLIKNNFVTRAALPALLLTFAASGCSTTGTAPQVPAAYAGLNTMSSSPYATMSPNSIPSELEDQNRIYKLIVYQQQLIDLLQKKVAKLEEELNGRNKK